jgi:pyridoxamine 5'-phosphate oxidase
MQISRGSQLLFFCLASTHRRTASGFSFLNRTKISGITSALLSRQHNIVGKLFSSSEPSTSMGNPDDDTSMISQSQSWRSLLEVSIAKSRKIRGSNYVQISTVEDDEPRCRTVVFRGFQKLPLDHSLSDTCDSLSTIMKMCTDLRSKKVTQHKEQPIAEMVWWFPKTSEQYRIRGRLVLVGNEASSSEDEDGGGDKALAIARKELWGNLSDPARESFLSTIVPGQAYNEEEKETSPIPAGGRGEDGKPVPVPENFLLMLMDPTNVDYLCLSGDQYRQIDARDSGEWTLQRVNP